MAVRAAAEAILEGIFFNYLARAWNALKGQVSQQAAQKLWEGVIKRKGLDNNQAAGDVIAKANISQKPKQRIREAIVWLDEREPIYAENFRCIIAASEDQRPKIKEKDPDGKEREIPDPNWISPGQRIIEDLANCDTDEEMRIAIVAIGVMDLAPDGTLEQMKMFALRVAMPYLKEMLLNLDEETFQALQRVQEEINRPYQERQDRVDSRRNIPLAEKVANPKHWWNIFRDNF